ncbi:ABC transporter ATP-binding protein [Vandammella animalimorsus]|uniref:ABC transporter ATP-binding protein/permease n=1 Tax=Vandammella animalimorsus TaxID=2029117 RepID=A0A2A2ACH7_9BURK|nr:ABC transporter ATP-binding protein [Vandammella animalimorsus]PAT36225.1 ABC transporter ATP-binding protein/permease [Vandammella animalimorsus]
MNAPARLPTRSSTRPPTRSWRATWRLLIDSAAPHAHALRRSLLMLAAAAVLQGLALALMLPIFSALLSATQGRMAGAQALAAALPWLLGFGALALAALALRWRAQWFDYGGQQADAVHRLRSLAGEQLRRMPLLQLQQKRAGEMGAALLGNVDEGLNYTITIATLITQSALTPLAAALGVLAWDWRLGLALLLVFPALIPLYRWRRPAFGRGMRALAEANAQCSGDVLEYAQGLAVLRAARCTGARAARLQESFERLERMQALGQKKGLRPNLIISSVVELSLLLVMAAGVSWAVRGQMDLAVLAAVAVMLARFGEPLSTVVSMTAIVELIETGLERIHALLAVPPLPQAAPAQAPTAFDIAFENVDFAYADGAPPVLQGFCARLPARGMTALVGPSGGGKTTITRLLMRHADPQAGRVCIGGVDVRHIPPEALGRLVSVVFQDVYLFNDSVLANIRMARPEASEDEVRQAARAAQCLDFIERLPQGWHTRIGEMGASLSGGERQRISIARALLKNAPIVVLDEPTAALDTESELAVQRAIEALVRERTVIVIAHRLSTIAGAGQIIVIDQGHALETGTHAELLAKNGRYAALWRAQQGARQWRA